MTPGTLPCKAYILKQIRHISKSLRNAFGRPQTLQRLCSRTLNFALRLDLAIIDFFATVASVYFDRRRPNSDYLRKGIPSCLSNARASASVGAVVTKLMFMPLTRLTLS